MHMDLELFNYIRSVFNLYSKRQTIYTYMNSIYVSLLNFWNFCLHAFLNCIVYFIQKKYLLKTGNEDLLFIYLFCLNIKFV